MRFGLAKYLDIIKINILTNLGLLPSPGHEFLCYLNL